MKSFREKLAKYMVAAEEAKSRKKAQKVLKKVKKLAKKAGDTLLDWA